MKAMRSMRKTLLMAAAGILALAACDNPNTESAPAAETASETTTAPGEPFIVEPDENVGAVEGAETPVAAIPAAFYGRWGMNAADCDPANADIAKGLMDISEDGLKFYESRATLNRSTQRGEDTLRAVFDFSGEGQTWTREMRLDLKDGGQALEREDFDGDLSGQALKYQRCPA